MDQETKEYLDGLKERIDDQSKKLDDLKGQFGEHSRRSALSGAVSNIATTLIALGITTVFFSYTLGISGIEPAIELYSFFLKLGIVEVLLGFIVLAANFFLIVDKKI